MSELAPAAHPAVRRRQRLELVRRQEEQISILMVQQRRELAALETEDRAGLSTRYVPDELAMVLQRSVRQMRGRVDGARMFMDFPAVHALVEDRTWLIDHADACVDELVCSGLEQEEQQRVLELVLSRRLRMTPYEVRAAVRTATVVLFPEHAADRAEKAKNDRDVRSYVEAPGVASLIASGPAEAIAAMMASLDALTFPPAPEDARSAKQRRFDALLDLVCGRVQPTQWQAQVLVCLTSLQGADELPAEIPGFGPIPASQAREIIAAGAGMRRVVVDENGQLVAVDSTVHRPDQPPDLPPRPAKSHAPDPGDGSDGDGDDSHGDDDEDGNGNGNGHGIETDENSDEDSRDDDGPGGPHHRGPGEDGPDPTDPDSPAVDDLSWYLNSFDPDEASGELIEPDETAQVDPFLEPVPPSAEDGWWYDGSTDRDLIYTGIDELRALWTPASGGAALLPNAGAELPTPCVARPGWEWSAAAFVTALGKIRTEPVRAVDLHSDAYAVPKRLKRHLELRDRTCVFPACPRKAIRCDKDHLLPWPRGSTSESNLASECEHHHLGKHDCLTVMRLSDGTFRWSTPCGITADRPPRPVLDGWLYRELPDKEPGRPLAPAERLALEVMQHNATDLGASGRDPIYGYGEVDATRMLGLPGGAPAR